MLFDQVRWSRGAGVSQVGREAFSCGNGVAGSQEIEGALGVTVKAEDAFQLVIAEHHCLPGSEAKRGRRQREGLPQVSGTQQGDPVVSGMMVRVVTSMLLTAFL
jgi:hypothetical protein